MPAEKFSPSELCRCGITMTPSRPDQAHHLFRQQALVPDVRKRVGQHDQWRTCRARTAADCWRRSRSASQPGDVNRLAIQSFQK